jgi:ferredoxin
MKREFVKIDEELCNGCGNCIPNCHEGALQIIDGKARLVSDLLCDGLGACIGHCPLGAISIEEREGEEYDETKVMILMVKKGKNTVIAHLKHMKDHKEFDLLKEGVAYLKENEQDLSFSLAEVISAVHNDNLQAGCSGGGCPGSAEKTLIPKDAPDNSLVSGKSELMQWPVQMHLINPQAGYFKKSDLLMAADCVGFAMGNFHQDFLKGKTLAIACPKLDSSLEIYTDKLVQLIDVAQVNTITVMIMQVPCCGGLLQLVKKAIAQAKRKVPVKSIMVSLEGEVLSEEWI